MSSLNCHRRLRFRVVRHGGFIDGEDGVCATSMQLLPEVEPGSKRPHFVRPSGAAKRSPAGKKTRTPFVNRQGGGNPRGACAEVGW